MPIAEELSSSCDTALEQQRLLGVSLTNPSSDGTAFLTGSTIPGSYQTLAELDAELTTITAFNELTFNPATQMEAKGSETKHPNPLMDAFLKKAGFSPEQQA